MNQKNIKKIMPVTMVAMGLTLSIAPQFSVYGNQPVVNLTASAENQQESQLNDITLSAETMPAFNTSDWIIEEWVYGWKLVEYIGDETQIYIPAKCGNGLRDYYHIEDLSILPDNVTHVRLGDPNNPLSVGDMSNAFSGHSNIEFASLHLSTNSEFDGAFENTPNLKQVTFGQDTLNSAENLSKLFKNSGVQVVDMGDTELHNLIDASEMFMNATSLQKVEFAPFAKNVQNMSRMFYGASSLELIDLKDLDLATVTNIEEAFAYTPKLVALNLGKGSLIGTYPRGVFKHDGYAYKELLIITQDDQLINSYPFHLDKTTQVFGRFDLDGGRFTDGSYYSLKGTGFFSKADVALAKKALKAELARLPEIAREGYAFGGWKQTVTNEFNSLVRDDVLAQMYSILSSNSTPIWNKVFTKPLVGHEINPSATAIYGTGQPGAYVQAFVNGKSISDEYRVNSKGNYKLTVSKLTPGATVQIKMYREGYQTVSTDVTVNQTFETFETFEIPEISEVQTTIYGKGEPGAAVGVYAKDGTRLDITKVNSKGNYKLTIPAQAPKTRLVFKQAKAGYETRVENHVVLYDFDEFYGEGTFTVKPYSTDSVAIYGTGAPRALVAAFVDGKQVGFATRVNSKGNYKLVIPKQKAGTKIEIEMSKGAFKDVHQTITVLDTFKTFTLKTSLTSSTKAIYGTGVPGSKVGIYTADGKRLAIATVNSKGNYKLVIPQQKVGTVLTIKQAKSGYLTVSKNVTVLKEFKTFEVTTKVNSKTTAIYGKGVAGSKVGVYDKNGKQVAITTVNSKGNYKLVIPKQKAGTNLILKQTKSGYATISKNIKVSK